MLHIAIPLAMAELGWVAMGVVDILFVGRLPDSAAAIGAASIGNAVFFSFAIFGIGLMAGLDTLVSQAFGAGDWPDARRSLAAGVALALAVTPLLALGILSAGPLLAALGVTPEIRRQAVGYIGVLVWSLPMLLCYTVFRRYLQGIHFVRPVTFALVTANLVNLLGNWLFVFGHWGLPAMGLRGSALSTVAARLYLAGSLLAAVHWRDPAAFRVMKADLARIGELFRLGLPAAITIGLEVGVFNAATALAGTLDTVSLAAHTIALSAASVTYMVPLGVSSAAAVSVGRAVGSRDRPGAARAGWIAIGLTVAYEIGSSMCFLLLPRQIAGAFTRDEQVISLAVTLLAIAAIFQLCDGLQTVATGALRGLGNTRTPMIWNLFGYWAIGLPLGYWLCFAKRWGAIGLWDGLCVGLVLIGLGLTLKWKRASRVLSST
jgi:MATE family multidrug resistance protein